MLGSFYLLLVVSWVRNERTLFCLILLHAPVSRHPGPEEIDYGSDDCQNYNGGNQ